MDSLFPEGAFPVTRYSFAHGAFVLIAAQLVTRIMGFVYRIFLTRMIGAAGMGLFQIVFPLLSLVLTIVTAGLPIAISKLVAEAIAKEDTIRVKRIMRVSTAVIIVMAIVCTILMWVLREFVRVHWLTDSRAYPSYIAMIPVVGIISISSIYRGYFRGLQDMAPTAWAQIIESFVRILSIWVLAAYFIRYSLAYAAAAAMMGMVLGEFAGLVYLIIQQKTRAKLSVLIPNPPARSFETTSQTLRSIGEIAVPVTLSNLIGSLIYAFEPVLVSRSLLLAGIATPAATMLYGEYSGMAIPLLVFPTVFTGALATSLVPSVSEAAAAAMRRLVRIRFMQSVSATAVVGFPTTVALTLFAEPLCRLTFHQPSAGPILASMAPVGFLLYLQGPLVGILQGLNRASAAMRNQIIGGVIRLGLIYIMASKPHLGILGVAYALSVTVALVTCLHAFTVIRQIGFAMNITSMLKTMTASLLMLAYMQIITQHQHLIQAGTLMGALFSGFILYFALLCMFRVVTSQNVKRVPKVGRVLSRLVSWLPFAA